MRMQIAEAMNTLPTSGLFKSVFFCHLKLFFFFFPVNLQCYLEHLRQSLLCVFTEFYLFTDQCF